MLQRSPAWPPDYSAVLRKKHRLIVRMHNYTPAQMRMAKSHYRKNPVDFIQDWCVTFDPRNAGTNKPTTMPFVLFPKQQELVHFLHDCFEHSTHGLIEKSRDMGATWVCVSFSVWAFLFHQGATIGWGSRKAAQVDKIGDMSSIFEKLRAQINTVPKMFWPEGFDPSTMMAQMKIFAPNGNSITGEAGDDVGRGGRTRIYFKDESAHYEHPEMIEAALGDNTNVQIDISSVNGLGNVFHRKREGGIEWFPGTPPVKGKTNVFVMDWSDHPAKTQAWYDEREAKSHDEGMHHIFKQEVCRDYAASVEGVVVPAEWVVSAIDAHVHLQFDDESYGSREQHAGLDVADEGGDRNALCIRRGPLLLSLEEWGARDTAVSARRTVDTVRPHGKITVQYDCIGVGAGVKAEVNNLEGDDLLPKGVQFAPWNAGAVVLEPDTRVDPDDPDTPINKEFYQNLKAQGWWNLRRRFEKTHRARQLANEGKRIPYREHELISLPSSLPLLRTLQKELSQPTMGKSSKMRLIIDKKPEGTRSPNLADAVMMAFWPVDSGYDHSMDWV